MINQGTTRAAWRGRIMAVAAAGLLAGSVPIGGGEGTSPTALIPGGDGNAVHASGLLGGSTAVGGQLNHFAGGRQPPPPPSPV